MQQAGHVEILGKRLGLRMWLQACLMIDSLVWMLWFRLIGVALFIPPVCLVL